MAGRPAKAASVSSGKVSKETRAKRAKVEAALKGGTNRLVAPEWMNGRQKEVFQFVIEEMAAGQVLGNVDIFVLTRFAVATERLDTLEAGINLCADRMLDKKLMAAKAKYTEDFKLGLRELCLSPQSRAKLSNMTANLKKEEEDPLLKLLKGKAAGA